MRQRVRVALMAGLATLLAGSFAKAQDLTQVRAQAPVSAPAVAEARDAVVLQTTAGDIIIALDPAAPITAANFLRYVDDKRLDGTDFYRSMVLGPNVGLVQGGTQNAPQRILAPIAHEATTQTRLSHTDGAVSMARNEPGTATGDFFIIVGNVSTLDADRIAPGDPGFAVFGHVIQGMDVVRAILSAPKSPTEGEGVMVGQMLEPRIRILSAHRALPPSAPD